MAPDLAARRSQLGVVLAYGRRAGARDAQAMQQPRAVGLTEVAEVVREHAAHGVILGALVFREVPDGLTGSDDAEAGLAGATSARRSACTPGARNWPPCGPGGYWSGSTPSSTSRVRLRATASARRRPLSQGESGLVLDLEPAQRVVEERIVRGLAVVARALAVEAPAIDTPCPAPTVGLEPIEPALDEGRLPHTPRRDQHHDMRAPAIGPGVVEELQLRLAAEEVGAGCGELFERDADVG